MILHPGRFCYNPPMPRGRCKYLILVWEQGKMISITCEQVAVFKDVSGFLCERHRLLVAETKKRYATHSEEEVVKAAEQAALHMAQHYKELRTKRKR